MSEVVQGPWSDRQLAEGEEKAKPVQLPRGIAGGGGGPHDPGMESRVAVLEQIAKDTRDAVNRLEGRIDGVDVRLRGVELSIGRLEGKIDALTGTIVGQTSAALAKLPSWWQMPAAIGATVVLLAGLYTGYRYLLFHGFL
jgi:hypothetical protein